MIARDRPEDEDFELDLIRDPEPSREVPESVRAMRARRQPVQMPTGLPSVQEVLHNPAVPGSQPAPQLHRILRRLMRAQLRLAVSLVSWFIGVVFVGNLAFHFSPALAATRLGGVPVEWLFPVVVVIPLLLFLGWFYVRRATAQERDVSTDATEFEAVSR